MTALCFILAAVDLFIGTQGLGNVTPAAAYPFGLVQAGPDTSASRDEFKTEKWKRFPEMHEVKAK